MVRAFVLAALAGGVLAIPGGVAAQPPDAEKTADPAEPVAILQTSRITYEKDLRTTPFSEVMNDIANRYKLPLVINTTTIENAGAVPDARAEMLQVARLEAMPLRTFLDVYFRALTVPDVTYLVRPDHIEITSRQAAQKEAGLLEGMEEAKATGDPAELVRAKARLNLPLVCVAVKEKPLAAVLADLSRVYGLNVVIDPGAREVLKVLMTEQLLNVPADTALELLAGQAGLTVQRKGNTFRITGGG